MSEERIKILELVSEGKLTPEQADLLLSTLEEKSRQKPDGKIAWDKATAELKAFGAQMSSSLAQSMTELRRGLETNLTNLSFGDSIASVFEHEFEVDVNTLQIESQNGRIRVERWTQPHVRMVVHADVRAEDQAKAREILAQAVQMTNIDQDVNVRFLTRFEGARVHGGRIDLYIPDTLSELKLETKNGAIFLDHANAQGIVLRTLNGQINIQHLVAKTVHATTQNGAIHLHHSVTDTTKEVYIESKNGAITVKGIPTGLPVRGQAKTSMGTVQVMHPDYEATYEQEHRRNACTFTPADGATDVDHEVSMYLETKNGKITIQ